MKSILLIALVSLICAPAFAGDNLVTLTLKDHKFTPSEIHVKAHTPTTVTLVNEDDATEEFDSNALKVEKVVGGHATATMRVRPLAPGSYAFMGEFHSETARGTVVAE